MIKRQLAVNSPDDSIAKSIDCKFGDWVIGKIERFSELEGQGMTHEQIAELFGRFHEASIWPTNEPRLFFFHRDGGEERTVNLYEDDGRARYLRVPLDEVRDHVEPTGRRDSKNVYYQLRRAA